MAKTGRPSSYSSEIAGAICEELATTGPLPCHLDAEKCADGIQALRHYRYEVEEAKSDPSGGQIALSKVPRHDRASHAADAFRTAAVMIHEPEHKKEQEKRPGSRLSPSS
jgi:hypothetical protein